jgi:hypothetical protein
VTANSYFAASLGRQRTEVFSSGVEGPYLRLIRRLARAAVEGPTATECQALRPPSIK